MRYKYNKKQWLLSEYAMIFKECTGTKTNDDELEYLVKFCDSNLSSGSKELYAYSLFLLKRFYPLWFVRWKLRLLVRRAMIKENAPESIVKLHKYIADFIVTNAMKNYGKKIPR